MTEKVKKAYIGSIGFGLPTFRIDVEGRMPRSSVVLYGILGISELADDRISLFTSRDVIVISGNMLKIGIFEVKRVEICGHIEKLEFEKRSRRGND